MKIVILGSGDVGFYLAEKLSSEGHQISIIDKNIQTIEQLSTSLDILAIQDSCLNPTALKNAGIEKANMVIAVTNSDETNLIACLLTKEFSSAYTIARVKGLEESYGDYLFPYDKIGVDKVINSDLAATNDIIRLTQTDHAYSKIMDFSHERMQLVRLDVEDHPQLKGKQLSTLRQQIWNYSFLVVLVVRKQETFIPKGDFILTDEDHLYLMINTSDIGKMLKTFHTQKKSNKKILIMGGENIALSVAQMLEKTSAKVTIIDVNQSRCNYLAEQLDSSIIIKGDATELSLLLEEGINNTNIFIAAGQDDKKNLLASILAKNNGAKKTICVMRRPDYVSLVNELGIDHIIAPRVSVSNEIIQNVRQGKITSFYALPETDIEIIEQEITEECLLTKWKLKDIEISQNLLIGGIIKSNNATLIPSGDYQCAVRDKIVIFAREKSIKNIEDLFK